MVASYGTDDGLDFGAWRELRSQSHFTLNARQTDFRTVPSTAVWEWRGGVERETGFKGGLSASWPPFSFFSLSISRNGMADEAPEARCGKKNELIFSPGSWESETERVQGVTRTLCGGEGMRWEERITPWFREAWIVAGAKPATRKSCTAAGTGAQLVLDAMTSGSSE